MLVSGEIWKDIYISFTRVMKGFSIAFGLAFCLGMLRALLPASGRYYEYVVQFFRNVPPLSMIPLLILWCGIGEITKTVIIVLASFFPMYLNIVKGFTGCDKKLLEVGDMFGYSKGRKFLRIVLPYASADVHGTWAHDIICPADVQDRQGHRGYPGHRGSGICHGPHLWPGNQQITERIL